MRKFLIICLLFLSFLNAFTMAEFNSYLQKELIYAKQMPILYKIKCISEKQSFHCYNLGMSYIKNDIYLANRYFKKACDFNSGTGLFCKNLAITFLNDKIYNPKKAIFYLKKACLKNDGFSCEVLGEVFYNTKINNKKILDKPDYEKAVFYSKKGCDLNNSNACWNLQYFYLDGIGVQKNRKLSDKYFKKSCKLKFIDGCESILNKEVK